MALSDSAPDFWIAAAAAAPVVALAGLVLITDAAVAGNIVRRAKTEHKVLYDSVAKGKEVIGPPTWWIGFYIVVNLLLQVFVLITALWALHYDSPPVPGLAIIVVEIIGLIFLLTAALLAGQVGVVRHQLEEKLEEKRRQTAADQLAAAIASKFGQPQAASTSHDARAGDGGDDRR
jgi:hypothetical protein